MESATYVIGKARLSIRLTAPYSEERKKAIRQQAKINGIRLTAYPKDCSITMNNIAAALIN